MSTIHFNQTTTRAPEQYVAGLTDFGGPVLGTVGKGVLAKAFVNSIKAIETRDNRSPA
jgi:hypothetical protein